MSIDRNAFTPRSALSGGAIIGIAVTIGEGATREFSTW